MKSQFTIRVIENLKKNYAYFSITRQIILVYVFAMVLIIKSDIVVEDLQKKEIELMKRAKKGNILVTLKLSGRRIAGNLIELADKQNIEVSTYNGGVYFVPSKMDIDSGQLYPVWYTDNLELLIARSVETREGNIQYLKDFNAKRKFTIDPAYVVLTILLLFFMLIDVFRNLRN